MSKKQKEAVASFAGSTGDESYLNPKGSDPVTLVGLADQINQGYEKGEIMRRTTCQQFIEVGRLLNIARTKFTSNTKFGAWRKKSIDFSQSHVQRLMQVASEFGEEPDAALISFGTLAVLTNASDELKDKIVADAKDGKTTTRAEVIAAKKEEKEGPPESAADFENSIQEKAEAVDPDEPELDTKPDPVDPVDAAQLILDMKFTTRISLFGIEGSSNPFINACILYGIPPYHDGKPSRDLVSTLYFAHSDKIEKAGGPDKNKQLDKLTEAHDILISVINAD